MADQTALQLSRFIAKAIKLVKHDIVTRKLLKDLGAQLVERIRKRTRLGWGVDKNGAKRRKLKEMRRHSEKYAAFRKKNKGQLSPLTKPARHNLTL